MEEERIEGGAVMNQGTHRPIVVGVDGSASSLEALRWAAEEAHLRGAELRVVTAWSVPWAIYSAASIPPNLVDDLQEGARQMSADAVKGLGAEFDDVLIRSEVVEGEPTHVLIEGSRDAQLLVLGCRGFGGFRELLLGSVSQQCAHHAACPVVIVRRSCDGQPDAA
jgi:nucleotide-binding universal stress UspA family protein